MLLKHGEINGKCYHAHKYQRNVNGEFCLRTFFTNTLFVTRIEYRVLKVTGSLKCVAVTMYLLYIFQIECHVSLLQLTHYACQIG